MEIVLAGAGVFVTLLVVVAMVLIVPRGAESVDEGSWNSSLAQPEADEAPQAADATNGRVAASPSSTNER